MNTHPRVMYAASGYETITVNSTVTGFTASKIAPSGGNQIIGALVSVETQPIRYTLDGTDPAGGGTGHKLLSGDFLEVWGSQVLADFQVVRDNTTNATLRVTYFKA
jgi:hypothetical protein